jgi:hypothetical protein
MTVATDALIEQRDALSRLSFAHGSGERRIGAAGHA